MLGPVPRALLLVVTALGCSAHELSGGTAAEGAAPTHPIATPEVVPRGGGTAGASATCEPSRPILVNHLANARDLGGLPLSSDGYVACGALFRGPPLKLTEPGCDEAAELGLKTVIDLRV